MCILFIYLFILLYVCCRVVIDYLKASSPDGKMLLTAIQVIGVLVANSIDPYNSPMAGSVSKQQYVISSASVNVWKSYCTQLLMFLCCIRFYGDVAHCMTHRLLSVYSSAAEVIGLVFNFLHKSGDGSTAFCDQVGDRCDIKWPSGRCGAQSITFYDASMRILWARRCRLTLYSYTSSLSASIASIYTTLASATGRSLLYCSMVSSPGSLQLIVLYCITLYCIVLPCIIL